MKDEPRPCVWMEAGMLRYKLCERDYDCEHCPLDAALSGQDRFPLASRWRGGRSRASYPTTCRYTRGHTWVSKRADPEEGAFAFGLDAFATAILDAPDRVSCSSETRVRGGEDLCALHFGERSLSLKAPFALDVRQRNEALDQDPETLLREPYENGWLVRFDPLDPASIDGLFEAKAARSLTDMDLRRYRREVAVALLQDLEETGPTLPDGGEILTDLRLILGAARYIELLRGLIH